MIKDKKEKSLTSCLLEKDQNRQQDVQTSALVHLCEQIRNNDFCFPSSWK